MKDKLLETPYYKAHKKCKFAKARRRKFDPDTEKFFKECDKLMKDIDRTNKKIENVIKRWKKNGIKC
jgi:hypothetical protein